MAKRKEYPSDHRRWFRVMEDILDDPGYRNLSPINQAVWIDLLAIFNRQQAHRQGNTVVLPWRSARALLRSQSLEGVLGRVRGLSSGVGLHAARVPEGLLLLIPNYAKSQGRTPTRLRCNSAAIPCTTTTTTTTTIEQETGAPSAPVSPKPEVPPPKPKPKPRREGKTPFPEDTTELEAAVRAWVRTSRGRKFSHVSVPEVIEVVGDWARSNAKRKTDWVATVRNAIRQGWAVSQGPGAPDKPRSPPRLPEILDRPAGKAPTPAEVSQSVQAIIDDLRAKPELSGFEETRLRKLVAQQESEAS